MGKYFFFFFFFQVYSSYPEIIHFPPEMKNSLSVLRILWCLSSLIQDEQCE